MRKALRYTSKASVQKCQPEDHTRRLPDEILVIILSLLSMREAVRTSILSRRWRILWSFFAGSLDFSASRSSEFPRAWFASWVNQVLRSHQGPSVQELIVCFDMDNGSYKCDTDSWIEFALRKQVRKLKLDFMPVCLVRPKPNYYTFPVHLPKSFTCLTELHLKDLRVTSEAIENLFSHALFLEVLSLYHSSDLVSIKLSGPSLKLKYLEIRWCWDLEVLEVSAENLVSLKYSGPRTRIVLKHVPSLAEASFLGNFSAYVIYNICEFSSYFTRLERLTLDLDVDAGQFPPYIPELGNLKYLELRCSGCNLPSLLSCNYLLDAAPLLHEVSLEIHAKGSICPMDDELLKFLRCRRLQKKEKYPSCLKVVEVAGFVGCGVVQGFIMFLLEDVASLEKVVINPHFSWNEPLEHKYNLQIVPLQQLAREFAAKLAGKLPPGVECLML